MLTRLRLRNFKAWREADQKFGKITGFFGTNSAGKSSLLQLLLLLKQTRNATDRGLVLDLGSPGDMANLGTFKDIVHGHDEDSRIGWNLHWTLPKTLKIADPEATPARLLFEGSGLQTRCEVGLRQASLWPHELSYRFGGAGFSLKPKTDSATQFELTTDSEDFHFRRIRGRPWPLPRPVKTYLFPNKARSFYQNAGFLGDFELEYEKLMDSIYYLGPLREYPRREYHWTGSSPEDVGQRGERTVDAILAATAQEQRRSLGHRKRRKTFQEMIAYWLKELGLIHEFRLEEIGKGTNLYRAMVKTSSSSVSTALTDVGFGVSQVLPALVLLYYVPEGSTVLMEQPEIHLHPSVQSGLADVMLKVATTRNVQIIVESHSEHLMRRLQRRVAEGGREISFEDVKLYFVSAIKGVAQAEDVLLNKWGEIENWPQHFFGDEMGEIAAIAKAALRRKLDRPA
ncbi:MAG: DUF3696 domain-containing protein [Gammaproteobacteria bacterium]|nr:DUF3696 domain-containing protein [Gammaproteobacteria bacterium]MDE0413505.1 DUF3696 domain-containing protein [Gammaproteobacteria bacterium]